MIKLTNEEIQKLRDIRIHSILHVRDVGNRVAIKCPIHSDNTPSFVLYRDNGFHCFGCGINGKGAIDFTMALGFSFQEAVEELVKYLK